MKQRVLAPSLLIAVLSAPVAHAAVLTGIADPGWDRSSAEGGHAAWEYWDVPAGQGHFENLAPDISYGGSPLTATLTQSFTGAGTSGNGLGPNGEPGRLLVSGTGTQFVFSLTGSGSEVIDSITLQIKHSNFLDASFAEIPSPFTVSLDGTAAVTGVKNPNGTTDPENYRWATSDPGSTTVFFWVYNYTWENLSIQPGEEFTLDFSSQLDQVGFGFSLDTISLDAHYAIPEPGSAALLSMSAACLLTGRRRRNH